MEGEKPDEINEEGENKHRPKRAFSQIISGRH